MKDFVVWRRTPILGEGRRPGSRNDTGTAGVSCKNRTPVASSIPVPPYRIEVKISEAGPKTSSGSPGGTGWSAGAYHYGWPFMHASCLREELIRIQKRIVDQLKREIRDSTGEESKELLRYREDYMRELSEGYKKIVTTREVIQEVGKADIVFFGDFHTLRQAPRIPLRILRNGALGGREVVLALETFLVEHQPVLDDFMNDRCDEGQLLERSDFNATWGFPWENFRDLVLLAKEKRYRLVGLNSSPSAYQSKLFMRDQNAARVIVREAEARPEGLVCVLYGDLHLASNHLPMRVREALDQRGMERELLTLFQNNEKIYWDLVEKKLEHDADAVWLGENRFCVVNCPPLMKFQSYMNWLEGCGELDYSGDSGWRIRGDEGVDFHDQVYRLIEIISDLLDIDAEKLSDFSVYVADDLDFLDRLQEQGQFTPLEIQMITAQIAGEESYFIHKADIIYLGNLSINHAAEEAAHFINNVCARFHQSPLPMKADFYYRSMREALGFFGSKIVNPHRPCYTEEDFEMLAHGGKYSRTDPQLKALREIGRHVRKHKAYERRWAQSGGNVRSLRSIYHLPTDLHLGVTHSLGYMLGDRMFHTMLGGGLSKEEVRRLFHERFETRDSAFHTYMDLASRLWP